MSKEKNKQQIFNKILWAYYRKKGRHDLPWRHTDSSYHILVSEIMLQQTQVNRVIEKYHLFLSLFPDIDTLARASLSDVLKAWSGLGYNRRAKYLHELARVVKQTHKGVIPKTPEVLRTLPGIGSYTAAAVCIFAYNQPLVCIETNIRTVFISHFFPKHKRKILDKEIEPLIEAVLDRRRPKEWYWALMDYGSFLKQQKNVEHRKSAHYKKQSVFSGSQRELRGMLIRLLLQKKCTTAFLVRHTKRPRPMVEAVLGGLMKEKMVDKKGLYYHLAGQ